MEMNEDDARAYLGFPIHHRRRVRAWWRRFRVAAFYGWALGAVLWSVYSIAVWMNNTTDCLRQDRHVVVEDPDPKLAQDDTFYVEGCR